ncbi:MAG: alpha-glucan family phosphorylase, partial [Chloroflexota bacterium]|nr:alpha-glucan family phosphorylase [Chloroflexota bacterium]
MRPIRTFSVVPSLPPQLERLRDVAANLRWAWNPDAIALFRRLDDQLWEETKHNPVLMLGTIEQSKLEDAANDEAFLLHLERVADELAAYLASTHTWFDRHHGQVERPMVAYFSPEFGVTDCLRIFAGGLGLLAGDHLKSASDLGVPLVAIGLLYQQGYFRQMLNDAGWQQEFSAENDFHNLPLELARNDAGEPLRVTAPHGDHEVIAQVWLAQVGRISLYLLDTNIDENRPEDRDITDQLYGGDLETRIRQEIVLGIGGCRVLWALGLDPQVFHMNEGHSAFLALERTRRLMEKTGLTFDQAREAASAGLIFTTHTPVPAGHDAFPAHLMDKYLTAWTASFGLGRRELLALGRQNPNDENEPFGMTVLALKMGAYFNGVSELHGVVSREMWQVLWPDVPMSEVPIEHVTNGVHLRSWVSEELGEYYDRYIGPRWRNEPTSEDDWRQAGQIPAEELWRLHNRRRERLILFARRRLAQQLANRGVSQAEINKASEVLDPEILTIGFARRFATYKRATLLLRDMDRLARIINDTNRPVQFIFAGKAHPRDDAGKELIRQVVLASRRPELRGRFVFLEDYDIEIARFLVQGVDVWLNNPRRPMEASGTSGMKAAANGVLNFSTLDGWWAEAWEAQAGIPDPVGWAIGRGENYENWDYQDQVEAEDLYDVLEKDIIPTFYDVGSDGLPRGWIARMQATIEKLCPFVNGHRMMCDYVEQFYLPSAERYRSLAGDNLAGARDLAAWRTRLEEHWAEVGVTAIESAPPAEVQVGTSVHAQARVRLGPLAPDDVRVELYMGRLNAD